MLASLSPDPGQFFLVDDAEKQVREQQLGLGVVLALGFSLLVHFFLALLVLPVVSTDRSSSDRPRVLEISFIEKTPEPLAVEPEKTEKMVKTETLPTSETTPEHIFPPENPVKEAAEQLFFPTAPASSASDMRAERIFHPRLRQQFYNSKRGQRNNEIDGHVEILGNQYYSLGEGKCLREMDNYGITDRDSEEYLMFNVRKVTCPGTEYESEGEAMVRELRNALARD